MSLLKCPPKICRSLFVAMTFVLVCAEFSLAKDMREVRAALRGTSLNEAQVSILLKKIDRAYSKEDVDNHIHWLQEHGLFGNGKLMQALPIVLPHPIDGDLDSKLRWFKGQGVQDVKTLINFCPELLGGSIQNDLEPKALWLKQQGIKNVKKFVGTFPSVFAYLLKEDLGSKISELKTHWGIGIAEIEKSPELLAASNIRVQSLRNFLDSIAKLAGDSQFDLKSLPAEERESLIRNGTANQVFDSLVDVKAIGADKASKLRAVERKNVGLSSLITSERKIVVQLYRDGKFKALLSHIAGANGAIPVKHKEIASYVEGIQKGKGSIDQADDLEVFLKKEGFAYIERKQIIEHEPGRRLAYSVQNVKNHLDWYKKQGLATTEEFTRALMALARYPIETDLQPKMNYLLSKEAGLKDAASLLRSSPESLARSLKDIQDKVKWAGTQGSTDVKKLVNTWPQFLKLSLEENLKPTVEWLQSTDQLLDVGKVINIQPSVLGSSLEGQLKPVGNWLKSLDVKDMGKLLSTYPRVLTYSLEETLKPRAEWFRSHGAQDVGRLLDKFPAILGYSIQNNDDAALWLGQHGVKDIGKVLGNFPQIVSYSINEKLNPKANWFFKHKFKNMGEVITKFPVILGLAIEDNLDPKLEEFKTHWGIGVGEFEKDPMIFIASNTNMQELRLFLDDIAKLGGDSHFNLKDLTLEQRKAMVQKLKASEVFERLKQTGAISPERKSLAELTSSERRVVAELYRDGELMQKLISRASSPRGLKPVTCYVDLLKQKLSIK